jgi:hypothetical protein
LKQAIKSVLRTLRRQVNDVGNRLEGYEPVGYGTVPSSLKVCDADECRVCGKVAGVRRPPRIVYLLPRDNRPVGGNKVSYRHSEIIARQGASCRVFHPEKPEFRYTWFANEIVPLKVGHFDPRTDFLVFSEMWAAIAAKFCVPAGIRYAISVQNGYLAQNTAGFSPEVLQSAYRHADLILSISADTSALTRLTHPYVDARRILRLFYSIPPIFSFGPKEKLITYMPRKLRPHSDRMRVYLNNILRDDWRVQAIENLDEGGVAELMSRSSIFLSFSELEGYPLPPIEAALSGNIVVGYTGQGAKEYFRPPVFREVENGDFQTFVREVEVAVADVEAGLLQSSEFVAQTEDLAVRHSAANEIDHLMTFVRRVDAVMSAPVAVSA